MQDLAIKEVLSMLNIVAESEGIKADIKIITRHDDNFISVQARSGRWEFQIKESIRLAAADAANFISDFKNKFGDAQ